MSDVAATTPQVAYSNAYIVVVARAIDILLGTFWKRDYGITISSYTRLEMLKPSPARWARALNTFLDFLEKDHCELARICDIERADKAKAILQGQLAP
jgi:hypothetical protein